jgi:exopolysaccharide biosynthesis protein
MFKRTFASFFIIIFSLQSEAQLLWKNVDSAFGDLPAGMHVFFTDQKIDTAAFRAFYVVAELGNKDLVYSTDTSQNRRFTPSGFYERNQQPTLVVNGTFFSFQTNLNLNLVMNNGEILSPNPPGVHKGQKDSTILNYSYGSAIGITKKRKADVAWVMTDSLGKNVFASQVATTNRLPLKKNTSQKKAAKFSPWKMDVAIGGGPVLVQDAAIRITNEEERKFRGKQVMDKHPRTAMGYTSNGKLLVLVVEGRNPDASGATLVQLAEILKDLGCVEALNLDGGGSSCLLINGKETIKPSDKEGQRPVPAVFIISARK